MTSRSLRGSVVDRSRNGIRRSGAGVECRGVSVMQVVAAQNVSVDADKFNEKVVEYVGIYFQYPSSPWNHSSGR